MRNTKYLYFIENNFSAWNVSHYVKFVILKFHNWYLYRVSQLWDYTHDIKIDTDFISRQFWAQMSYKFTIIREKFLNEKLHIQNSQYAYIWTCSSWVNPVYTYTYILVCRSQILDTINWYKDAIMIFNGIFISSLKSQGILSFWKY